MSMAAPATRAVAGQSKSAATQKAFFGRPAAGSKASVADAFSAMSLSAPTKARGLSICGAYASHFTRTTRRDPRGASGASRLRRGRARDHRDARQKDLRPETRRALSAHGGGVNRPRLGTREARTRDREEHAARTRTGARGAAPRAAHLVPSPRVTSRVRVAPPRFATWWLFSVAAKKRLILFVPGSRLENRSTF